MRGVLVAAMLAALATTAGGCAEGGWPELYGQAPPAPPAQAAAAVARNDAGGTPPVAAPAVAPPQRADAVLAARRCGAALGIAARCNLLRDDRDFAVVRYAVLGGLAGKYGQVATAAEIEEMLDLATLDRLTSIGTCTVPGGDEPRVEAGVRASVDACARP